MQKLIRLISIILVAACGIASAQTSNFTYQGKLNDGGLVATAQYDFTFKLYDSVSGGTQIGADVVRDDAQVTAGIFTVNLNFGASSFTTGAARFLEIAGNAVRPGGCLECVPHSTRTAKRIRAVGERDAPRTASEEDAGVTRAPRV